MKFLLCLALCFAAAQAGIIGVPGAVTYSAPALYNAPLAYTGYPSVYSAGLAAPAVYSAGLAAPAVYSAGLAAPAVYSAPGLGLQNHVVSSAYAAAPAVYSSPNVYSTLLKK